MKLEAVSQYELIDSHWMAELNAQGYLLRHKKSKARVFLIENEDDNKVFNIAFRTPPTNSTGVPHIIEHTVLCGSKKYPARDPFVELVKGSLNTFLNAITYPDKTMYPVASTNDKDFENLMSVYMDAVFHPNITKTDKIFKQEGWHYEYKKETDTLVYNGVVYNEMKGAFSSADDVLGRYTTSVLYPDTTYSVVSGGAPEEIPTLTYEAYLAFYKRYYHPSNSYIYLYGDMDMAKVLNWMDEEYLSHYESIEPDSEITMQPAFDKMAETVIPYSITEAEKDEAGYYFSWNKVTGNSLDDKLYLAFQILEYVLMTAPGAPLKQALLDAGIGEDIYGGFEDGILQPYFNVTAKDADEEQKEAFVQIIEETLKKVVREGINKRSLLAAINSLEFKLREGDFGRWPKGLMIGLQCFDSWLYNEDPYLHLEYDKTLAYLKEQIETDYYETLIKTWLIENTHGAMITAKPEIGLTEKQEQEIAKQLKEYKDSLSKEELDAIIREEEELRIYQETPTPQEILEKIPMLEISDIRKEVLPLCNEERMLGETKVLFHDLFTSGISYIEPVFQTDFLTLEELPYLVLLKRFIGSLDTESYRYQELADEINISTGGITPGYFLAKAKDEPTKIYFSFRVRVLYESLEKACELLTEMMLHTLFTDEKRMKEILAEMRSRKRESLQDSGHATAIRRAGSYESEISYLNDWMDGIGFYRFLDDLYRKFDEKKKMLSETLTSLAKRLFTKENMFINYTANEEGYALLQKISDKWIAGLGHGSEPVVERIYPFEKKKEGFTCASQIQFVARTGNFMKDGLPYDGSLRVLQNILNYDYLWHELREKGGAYGCMSGFSRDGQAYFASYLDPHVKRTNEVYEGIPAYVKEFTVSKRDMTKYIIGAISEADIPMNPMARGNRGMQASLCGITIEMLQKERDQVLSTDQEKIRSLAPYMEAILASDCLCAVGNEGKLKEAAELFYSLEQL